MNKILPFKKPSQAEAFSLDKQALSAVLHLKRLKRSGETVHQETGFGLADQVLTHLLVRAGVAFDLIVNNLPSDRNSIQSITADRYGLDIVSDAQGLDAEHLLANWSVDALVQYVLDHEVPADPRDFPGFDDLALAG